MFASSSRFKDSFFTSYCCEDFSTENRWSLPGAIGSGAGGNILCEMIIGTGVEIIFVASYCFISSCNALIITPEVDHINKGLYRASGSSKSRR